MIIYIVIRAVQRLTKPSVTTRYMPLMEDISQDDSVLDLVRELDKLNEMEYTNESADAMLDKLENISSDSSSYWEIQDNVELCDQSPQNTDYLTSVTVHTR